MRRATMAITFIAVTGGGLGACSLGCPTALAEGTLVETSRTTLGVRSAFGGGVIEVRWPLGYGVRTDGGRLVLADGLGSVVARQGDTVSMGGGDADGVFAACGPVAVRAAP